MTKPNAHLDKGEAPPDLDVIALDKAELGGAAQVKDAKAVTSDTGASDASGSGPSKPPPPPQPAALRILRAVGRVAAEQWFLIGLGVAIGLAAAVPNLGRSGGWIAAEYSIKIPATVLIFIISGIGLKTKALLGAVADAWVHVRVQAISLVVLPAVGYGIAVGLRAGGFNRYLADGFIVMAAMPTTVSTNVVFTQRAGGNEPAALVNAVIGNIIGIFITPLWLTLFLNVKGQAPYAKVLIELSYTVIAPLILGQILQYVFPRAVAWIKAKINTADVSSLCILLLVWSTFCSTFADPKSKAGARDAFSIVGLDIAFFATACVVSYLVAWPPVGARGRRLLRSNKADAVAIIICGSTKTVALGVPLITVLYGRTDFAGLLATPLIIYHALQILLGGATLTPLRRWRYDEPLLPRKAAGGETGAGAAPAPGPAGTAAPGAAA